MGITQEIINAICELVQLNKDSFQLQYQDYGRPNVDLQNRIIVIEDTNSWREIYQFSHEALHLSFFDHNNQVDTTDVNWIEEVVCEAFSLYCLHLFAKDEIQFWFNYMKPWFYLEYCGVEKAKEIVSLEHLNKELLQDKDFETLQYIHPYILSILNVLSDSIDSLKSFLGYTKMMNGNRITTNNNCKIAFILQKLQTAADGTLN